MTTMSSLSGSAAAHPCDLENRVLEGLIVEARCGNVRAFEELYLRTSRRLLFQVLRIVRDGQAEDVLAEVYLQVWNSLGTYDSARAVPMVWLAMIARSRALDHLRREARVSPHASDCLELPEERSDGPEQILAVLQDRQRVQVCLLAAGLSEAEERAVALAYFQDSSQQEIAAITGWPLGTVKSVIGRAQSKLRAAWRRDSTAANDSRTEPARDKA